jgi:putative hydrolase of HD superfamily
MDNQRLKTIIDFMQVTERMKSIYRTVQISTLDRGESDAEHSWHMALFLMLLENDLPQDIDKLKLYKILLIHDLVEVYAGDTAVYDDVGRKDKVEREAKAAEKLFGQLPDDLKKEFFDLFNEFEEMKTVEAKIAKAIDKLHPLLQNLSSEGTDYKKFGAMFEDEKNRIEKYVEFNETLKQISEFLLEEANKKSYFK